MAYSGSSADPAGDGFAVTPDDDVDFTTTARALYIGGDGDVVLKTAAGTILTFVGLTAGTILPVRTIRVYEASTATDMVGLY